MILKIRERPNLESMHIQTQPQSALFIAGLTVNKKISHISEETSVFLSTSFHKRRAGPKFWGEEMGAAALSDNWNATYSASPLYIICAHLDEIALHEEECCYSAAADFVRMGIWLHARAGVSQST
jgi:hypothetical protein